MILKYSDRNARILTQNDVFYSTKLFLRWTSLPKCQMIFPTYSKTHGLQTHDESFNYAWAKPTMYSNRCQAHCILGTQHLDQLTGFQMSELCQLSFHTEIPHFVRIGASAPQSFVSNLPEERMTAFAYRQQTRLDVVATVAGVAFTLFVWKQTIFDSAIVFFARWTQPFHVSTITWTRLIINRKRLHFEKAWLGNL